jgi:DNA-binding HxlR family transcriptional regulator
VSDSWFSKELEQFIAEEIQSLEQVEILLLLSGNPHKSWNRKGVYDVVKSNLSSVEARLEELSARGILTRETQPEVRYRFAPAEERIWKVVNELRDAYKERPVKVVQAIYSKPPDAVQEFARAFRVRKDK